MNSPIAIKAVQLAVFGALTGFLGTALADSPTISVQDRLSAIFADITKKKVAVGGTVLRGSDDLDSAPKDARRSVLELTHGLEFKVMPASKTVVLHWPSHREKRWALKIDEVEYLIRGGEARIDLSVINDSRLHSWELRDATTEDGAIQGFWFFYQGVNPEQSTTLLELLPIEESVPVGLTSIHRDICSWMWAERIINFNASCSQR